MKLSCSNHARERIKQRLNTSDKKIPKLIEKAWNSDTLIPRVKYAQYKVYFHRNNRTCKELMGYVFVFAVSKEEAVLITVF
jgi:hypothetical protein